MIDTTRFCGVDPVPGPTVNQLPPEANAVNDTGVFGSVLVSAIVRVITVEPDEPCVTVSLPNGVGWLMLSSALFEIANVTGTVSGCVPDPKLMATWPEHTPAGSPPGK